MESASICQAIERCLSIWCLKVFTAIFCFVTPAFTVDIQLTCRRSEQIKSVNYPDVYENNHERKWQITAPSGERLFVRFEDFETKEGDILKLSDGMDLRHKKRYSGHHNDIPPFLTYGNTLNMIFKSDDEGRGKGFNLHVECYNFYQYPVELSQKRRPNIGLLQVYSGSKWRELCTDNWDLHADIACRQIGYPGAFKWKEWLNNVTTSNSSWFNAECRKDEAILQTCDSTETYNVMRSVSTHCNEPGYRGCYEVSDSSDGLLQADPLNVTSLEDCLDHCRGLDRNLSLINKNQCYCHNDSNVDLLPDHDNDENRCQTLCSDGQFGRCGGDKDTWFSAYDASVGFCEDPPTISNGEWTQNSSYFGSVLILNCSEGYIVNGPKSIVCGPGRSVYEPVWSSPFPSCRPIPPEVEYSTVTQTLLTSTSPTPHSGDITITVSVVVGILILSLVVFLLVCEMKRRKSSTLDAPNVQSEKDTDVNLHSDLSLESRPTNVEPSDETNVTHSKDHVAIVSEIPAQMSISNQNNSNPITETEPPTSENIITDKSNMQAEQGDDPCAPATSILTVDVATEDEQTPPNSRTNTMKNRPLPERPSSKTIKTPQITSSEPSGIKDIYTTVGANKYNRSPRQEDKTEKVQNEQDVEPQSPRDRTSSLGLLVDGKRDRVDSRANTMKNRPLPQRPAEESTNPTIPPRKAKPNVKDPNPDKKNTSKSDEKKPVAQKRRNKRRSAGSTPMLKSKSNSRVGSITRKENLPQTDTNEGSVVVAAGSDLLGDKSSASSCTSDKRKSGDVNYRKKQGIKSKETASSIKGQKKTFSGMVAKVKYDTKIISRGKVDGSQSGNSKSAHGATEDQEYASADDFLPTKSDGSTELEWYQDIDDSSPKSNTVTQDSEYEVLEVENDMKSPASSSLSEAGMIYNTIDG